MLDVLRVLKGGRSLADSLATHPEYFSDLYVNMVRAGEASGSLAAVFERLAEFERTRDDLRSYIISSMIYPALLTLVGIGVDLRAAEFRGAALRHRSSSESRMKMPLPTKMMLEASKFVQAYGLARSSAIVVVGCASHCTLTSAPSAGRLWWDTLRLKIPAAGRCAAQGGDGAVRARHGDPGGEQRAAGAVDRHRRRDPE